MYSFIACNNSKFGIARKIKYYLSGWIISPNSAPCSEQKPEEFLSQPEADFQNSTKTTEDKEKDLALINRNNYIQSIAADQFDWYQLDNYYLSGYAEGKPKLHTSVRKGFRIWIEFMI